MRKTILLVTFVSLVFIALAATAQMPMPKPAPELSKLDYLAGDWISDGDMKPSPMGPGGKMSSVDHVQWMEGNFFLVMHSKFKGAMGDGTALAVMGYDPDKKVFTYNEYNSMGQINHSEGTVSGDTWSWTSDENMGGQTLKGRYTMKVLSPTSYTFKYEMSQDGTTWTTAMDGKSTKK
ncbi:MAG TPA: DUF1579 family protein [Terriglobales bacterium]|jgi:hypothetical protein